MGKHSYEELEHLKGYYFEDSYVLKIQESPSRLEFELEVVLTPAHDLYQAPEPGMQHCYRKAKLVFTGIEECKWIERGSQKFVDANREIDFGNIDTFCFDGVGGYDLKGSWGSVSLKAKSVDVIIE